MIEYVTQGIPVIVGIGHNSSLDYGTHTAVAYDYDETKDELYFNMGWGNNASRIEMETLGYSSINNALVLWFDDSVSHSHSDNYKKFSFDGIDGYCSCEYAKPFSIEETREEIEGNLEISFNWKCLKNEKWDLIHSPQQDYNFSISYYDNFDVVRHKTTSNCFYALDQIEKNNLLQLSHYNAHVDYIHDGCQMCSNATYSKHFTHQTVDDYRHGVSPSDYGLNVSGTYSTVPYSLQEIIYNPGYYLDTRYSNAKYNGDTIELLGANSSNIEYCMSSYFLRIDYDIVGDFSIYYKAPFSWEEAIEGADYTLNVDEETGDSYIEFFKRWKHIRIVPKGNSSIYIGDMFIWNKLPTSGYEIPYDTSLWNYYPLVNDFNCYSYAINNQTTVYKLMNEETPGYWHFQDPGDYFYYERNDAGANLSLDEIPDGYSCLTEYYAAMDFERYNNDFSLSCKFEKIGRFERCEEETYKIALVFYVDQYGGEYYHWLRQNPDGTWSQKDGDNHVTNRDMKDGFYGTGDLILDPLLCNRGIYTIFHSYYKVTPWNNIYYDLIDS